MSDTADLRAVVNAAVESWPNRVWLILPGPTDLGPELAKHVADAVVGWRPPARVITDPAELDALPIHSVALTPSGYPWWLTGRWPIPSWSLAGNHRTSAELLADCRGEGVTLLHIPAEIGDIE
jgi:hypothetical protein